MDSHLSEADTIERPTEAVVEDFDHLPRERVPVLRTLLGGTLMGAANLVPGISGGTMVLACGLYGHFVDATADATRLKFTRRSVAFLLLLWGAKLAAMGALARPVTAAVVSYPAIAYAVFAGMTLAGTPILWRLLPKGRRGGLTAVPLVLAGVVVMLLLTPPTEKPPVDAETFTPTLNIPKDLLVGGVALSAMVLPGVSGGTMKLVLGRYEPTVWSIGQTWAWLVPWEDAAPVGQWVPIIAPYVIGAVIGLFAVSNLLKWLLKHYENLMAALLLGVLWGSAVVIWPRGVTEVPQVLGLVMAAAIGFVGVYALTWVRG